ncbi:MAG: extracellular solute-binding protein [Alphaproteobacteria bacterium]|nr:MAG: extracellular solute-binding protein [Alphaproteobacteria bacterium]
MRSDRIICAAATAAFLIAASCALAQSSRAPDVAGFDGADRQQRLIEGAKREKELTFYSSIPPADISALVAAFDKKYGIKVKVWRADSEGFLQRILSEARARRFEVDIMAGSSSALEPLYRENLLQEVKSPYLAEVIPQAVAPHRQWVAVYLSLFVQAYNTNLIAKDSLPKSYADLARPQWAGKLGIEAEDFDWFAEVVTLLGEERGLRLFRAIVETNGISVRKGHSLLNNLVAAGEVPLALSDYSFLAEQSKRKGAPLDWFVIAPAIARATAQGLARNAPHPYAAVLFYDFLLSDAQPILAGRQFVSVSRSIEPLYKGPLNLIDSGVMLDQARKWQDLFQKTIIGPSR